MDAFIRAAVARVTGASAAEFDWNESRTTPDEIARLVATDGPADLVFVTDHVNETTRAFDPELVDLANENDRVAIGGELQTVVETQPGSGRYAPAPEVLLYGGPDRMREHGGWHYGISAEWLATLQSACRPAGAPRAELHRVLAYCRTHRIAHALSHPLDGHTLDLETTLTAVAACRFIEVVNGGFGSDSADRLARYLAVHNCLRSRPDGASPCADAVAADRDARWLAAHVRDRSGDGATYVADDLVTWGGSDAHLGRYDRVCVRYRPPVGIRTPGFPELVSDMLDTPTAALIAEDVLTIEGRGNGLVSCLAEVLGLVLVNARRNLATFREPRRLARLVALAPALAVGEVLRHRRQQQRLGAALDRVLATMETALVSNGPGRGRVQDSLSASAATDRLPCQSSADGKQISTSLRRSIRSTSRSVAT